MVSFKKMVHILRLHPYLFTLMDLIFPYKEFANTVIGNVTYLMDLFTNLYLANVNFKIIIDKTPFVFQSNQNELKMICVLVINHKFILDLNTSIERILTPKSKPTILFKIIPELIKDTNKDYILWNYYTYLSILNIIKTKKEETIDANEIKKIISQYFGKLKAKPTLIKNLESFNISRFFEPNIDSSLFGKAWSCVLNFDANFLNYIKTFCLKIEKLLINLAYILNQIIQLKYKEPILNLCESMKEFLEK